MYKLKRHALDISATGNHFSRDFSDIEDEVSLVNTRALPLDAYFALKTKTSAKFIDSSISSKDLLFEIQKWTKGKQWSSPEIVLQNIHNFDIFDFFEAMCEKSPVEDPVPYLEWTLLREKSNEYPVLVVRMSTFERSVTMKQCRKIFMQNW